MTQTTSPAGMAGDYSRRGWHVFPLHTWENDRCSCGHDCSSPAKHPRTPNGLKDATADPAQVDQWWKQWPQANIGVVTGEISGLVVVDVDGSKGETSLSALEQQHGPLPDTVRAITGGDGMHILFAHPGQRIRNSASKKLGAGLDVRGDGGYIVAAPSLHRSGQLYEWLTYDSPLAPLPAWLLELVREATPPARTAPPTTQLDRRRDSGSLYGLDALARELADLRNATEGNRNHQLNEAAFNLGQLVAGGELDETLVRHELEAYAASIGLHPGEIGPTITSGLAAGNASPRTAPETPPPSNPATNGNGKPPAGDDQAATPAPGDEHYTDVGNAKRLVRHHGTDIRYCAPWGTWLTWDGRRWKKDTTGEIWRRAKNTVDRMLTEAVRLDDAPRKKLIKHALDTEKRFRMDAMIRMAESEPGIPVVPDQLDAHHWLLNVENGTIDLRTGQLREHRRKDGLTKMAPVTYQPDAEAPTWHAFLQRIFDNDVELTEYFQRAVGYALTGLVTEQVLFFLYGAGANGKSTALTALQAMLGEYARQADPELLLARTGDAHPTNIASLQGVRLAIATEIDSGRRLAESTVKQLTGGDRITARYMRQDFFEFWPTHKFFLAANHKPVVRGTDYAIWRRLRLIPFDITIPAPERDRHLDTKLRRELPGILAWAVRGCLAWQQRGLGTPPTITEATAAYRQEMDIVGQFIADELVVNDTTWITAKRLRQIYEGWCAEQGDKPWSAKAVGAALTERGFISDVEGRQRTRVWRGIGEPDPAIKALQLDMNPENTHSDPTATHTADASRRIAADSPRSPHTHARTASIGNKAPHPPRSVRAPDDPTAADPELFEEEF